MESLSISLPTPLLSLPKPTFEIPKPTPLTSLPFASSRGPKLVSFCSRKSSSIDPVAEVEAVEQVIEEEEVEFEDLEEFDDETLEDDFEEFGDDMESMEPYAGDGGGGGGVSLCGTWWDKEALSIVEETSMSFNGDLKIFAFKTTANQSIRVRIEKMSTKYGSPSMADIEEFSAAYRARLDEAVTAKTIPENFSLEVSSPGVERAVRIPGDLERFKDRPMRVKYTTNDAATDSSQESEGIFRLVTFDLEERYCIWSVADVRTNREKAGKGRPLNKKQRDWRLQTPFESLRLVRLYSEC